MMPGCDKRFDSIDPDDMEGYGRCTSCKAKMRDIVIKAENILAHRRKNDPIERMPSMLERFDVIETPNKYGGVDKRYIPKR
jgi:hypothetical protein